MCSLEKKLVSFTYYHENINSILMFLRWDHYAQVLKSYLWIALLLQYTSIYRKVKELLSPCNRICEKGTSLFNFDYLMEIQMTSETSYENSDTKNSILVDAEEAR